MSSQLKLTDITKKFEANTVNEKVALDPVNLPCLTSSSEAFFQMKEKCT